MHTVRKARRMCLHTDTTRDGHISSHAFKGVLAYLGIRLMGGEQRALEELFRPPEEDCESELICYPAFFQLMEPRMPEVRTAVVRDAYIKLQNVAGGGLVTISDIQRLWDPRCYPEVQQERMLASEAREDFLRQWEITSADGLVPFEVFLDY